MSPEQPFSWSFSSRSDVGSIREFNEDACVSRPDIGLWAVADGMGGHADGGLASNAVVRALTDVEPRASLSTLVEQVEDRILTLNAQLREMALREEVHTIGCTVAVLMLHGRFGACLWAGDSRIYRSRQGELVRLTQDHALGEELVERGILSAEDAVDHPQSNLVTRAVGASEALHLDAEIFELEDHDRFVLCSDGLDKELEEPEIASTIEHYDVARLSDRLVDLALSRNARDNVTVVCVEVRAGKHG